MELQPQMRKLLLRTNYKKVALQNGQLFQNPQPELSLCNCCIVNSAEPDLHSISNAIPAFNIAKCE